MVVMKRTVGYREDTGVAWVQIQGGRGQGDMSPPPPPHDFGVGWLWIEMRTLFYMLSSVLCFVFLLLIEVSDERWVPYSVWKIEKKFESEKKVSESPPPPAHQRLPRLVADRKKQYVPPMIHFGFAPLRSGLHLGERTVLFRTFIFSFRERISSLFLLGNTCSDRKNNHFSYLPLLYPLYNQQSFSGPTHGVTANHISHHYYVMQSFCHHLNHVFL